MAPTTESEEKEVLADKIKTEESTGGADTAANGEKAKGVADEDAKAEEAGAEEPEVDAKVRDRVGEGRCVGLIVEWRGYMGWIVPLLRIKHPLALKHHGRVYLNAKDIDQGLGKERVRDGKIVDFYVYADRDGLGADDCRVRSALRLTVPHKEANRMLTQSSQWSEYLTDSEYYPTFEREHGVLLRKYAWNLTFAVLELWGHPDELAASAVELSTKGRAEVEEAEKAAEQEKAEKESKSETDAAAEPSKSAETDEVSKAAGVAEASKAAEEQSSQEACKDADAEASPAKREKDEQSGCHLRLLLPDTDVEKASKALPKAKVSPQQVVQWPVACHSLTIQAPKEEAMEAVKEYLNLMACPVEKQPTNIEVAAWWGGEQQQQQQLQPKAQLQQYYQQQKAAGNGKGKAKGYNSKSSGKSGGYGKAHAGGAGYGSGAGYGGGYGGTASWWEAPDWSHGWQVQEEKEGATSKGKAAGKGADGSWGKADIGGDKGATSGGKGASKAKHGGVKNTAKGVGGGTKGPTSKGKSGGNSSGGLVWKPTSGPAVTSPRGGAGDAKANGSGNGKMVWQAKENS